MVTAPSTTKYRLPISRGFMFIDLVLASQVNMLITMTDSAAKDLASSHNVIDW
jgi:hypothetical protein